MAVVGDEGAGEDTGDFGSEIPGSTWSLPPIDICEESEFWDMCDSPDTCVVTMGLGTRSRGSGEMMRGDWISGRSGDAVLSTLLRLARVYTCVVESRRSFFSCSRESLRRRRISATLSLRARNLTMSVRMSVPLCRRFFISAEDSRRVLMRGTSTIESLRRHGKDLAISARDSRRLRSRLSRRVRGPTGVLVVDVQVLVDRCSAGSRRPQSRRRSVSCAREDRRLRDVGGEVSRTSLGGSMVVIWAEESRRPTRGRGDELSLASSS